ncbi:glutamate racemase [Desulfitobacterium chlororespirans DSM 11544]|uniref:Glutamate racemase n=1 Tax=Desulfitobacterium chlororespirans DSM 11544 TaxID=1121395 RepID=A0A1M7UYG3_9FIRM|nr:glutamate racemase [Desulfitobacterium chlororespirans DSM 11544]
MAQHVIGMFDSGVGGLTVMKEIVTQLPDVQIIYFGDTARVPYGNRSREELIHFGEEIISFLIEQGAEAIVVACNTSSANAVPVLREQFNLPLIGTIEPGAKAAIQATATGNIGLIATEATVRSKAYSSAVRRILSKRQGGHAIELVKAQACPLFVPLVEAGLFHSPEARGIARTYLAPIQEAQVDALILGCTHYPFLAPVIQEILGEEIILVDPAQAMTEELKEVLKQLECNRESGRETHKAPGHHRFFVSGDPVLFERVGNTLLPGQIHDVNQVNWNR